MIAIENNYLGSPDSCICKHEISRVTEAEYEIARAQWLLIQKTYQWVLTAIREELNIVKIIVVWSSLCSETQQSIKFQMKKKAACIMKENFSQDCFKCMDDLTFLRLI